MTNLGVLAIWLSANVLFAFKFAALLEAESRLGGLRAEALQIERVHGQARLLQVAQREEFCAQNGQSSRFY
jgi:hypothetical protein